MTDAKIQGELLALIRTVHPSFRQRGKREFQEPYTARLMVALNDVNDIAWNSLSESAQNWCNEQITRLNRKRVPRVPARRTHRSTARAQGAAIPAEIFAAAQAIDPLFQQRHEREPEDDFALRCLAVLADIGDEAWYAMSASAQNWYNENVTRLNERTLSAQS